MDPKSNQKPEDDVTDEEKETMDTRKYVGINEAVSGKFSPEDVEYLSSKVSWEALGLDNGLCERLIQIGYKKPSFIQSKVIKISKNNSVVAQAQNGSGKTLAYIVPILRLLNESQAKPSEGLTATPQVVILADTKALIMQIAKIIKRITEGYKDFVIDYTFSGKFDVNPRTQILISTIAQVRTAVQKKTVDFSNAELIVVDEADHVFESDLSKNFFQLFVHKLLKAPNFKVIFTSATMTDDFRKVIQIVQEKRNLIQIELPVEQLTLKNVQQYKIFHTGTQMKKAVLEQVISKINAQNILIFDNRKQNLLELLEFLNSKNYKAAFIYKSDGDEPSDSNTGDVIQKKIDDFLAGKYRILLTTNLLSRGIDMRKVTLVVNYSLPVKYKDVDSGRSREIDLETYLHRVGRTGRFGDHGIALNFVDQKYESPMIDEISNYYKNEISEIRVDQLSSLNQQLEEIQNLNKEKREYLEENI